MRPKIRKSSMKVSQIGRSIMFLKLYSRAVYFSSKSPFSMKRLPRQINRLRLYLGNCISVITAMGHFKRLPNVDPFKEIGVGIEVASRVRL